MARCCFPTNESNLNSKLVRNPPKMGDHCPFKVVQDTTKETVRRDIIDHSNDNLVESTDFINIDSKLSIYKIGEECIVGNDNKECFGDYNKNREIVRGVDEICSYNINQFDEYLIKWLCGKQKWMERSLRTWKSLYWLIVIGLCLTVVNSSAAAPVRQARSTHADDRAVVSIYIS